MTAVLSCMISALQPGGPDVRPSRPEHYHGPAHDGGRGRASASRLRLRQDVRLRSLPAVRRFPQRAAGGLSQGLSLASPSRHRDDHLCAGRHGRAWRQPRQPRRAGRGRRAVDDGGPWHHAPGDAAGRRQGPHARLPALGQPAVLAQDDGAALPGRDSRTRSRRSRTTTAPSCASSAASSGGSAARRRHRRRSALSRCLCAAVEAQDT